MHVHLLSRYGASGAKTSTRLVKTNQGLHQFLVISALNPVQFYADTPHIATLGPNFWTECAI